jgi:endonuclease G
MNRIFIILIILLFPLISLSQVGLPSRVGKDTIVKHLSYTSCYSTKHQQPNWVYYTLYKPYHKYERKGLCFFKDTLVSTPHPDKYIGSGYDKGHNANAESFSYDKNKMKSTFCMSNITPQHPIMNRGIFKETEILERKIAMKDSIIVITGSIFSDKKIPNTKITIPSHCYKIIYNYRTKTCIAFLFLNSKCVGKPKDYLITVKQLENLTKINFFKGIKNQKFEEYNDLNLLK